MRTETVLCVLLGVLSACGADTTGTNDDRQGGTTAPGAPAPSDPQPSPTADAGKSDARADGATAGDVYKAVFDAVDRARLEHLLQDMTGVNDVTAGGRTFRITERWSPAAKASFRAYWLDYFRALGATAHELTFPISQTQMDSDHLVDETQ